MKKRIPHIIALCLFGLLLLLGLLSAQARIEERHCLICGGGEYVQELSLFGLPVFNTRTDGQDPLYAGMHKVAQRADHVYWAGDSSTRNPLLGSSHSTHDPLPPGRGAVSLEECMSYSWASRLVHSHTPPDCTTEEKAKLYQSIYGAVHANLLPSVDIKELYKAVRTNDECVAESFIEGLTLNR